MAKIIYPDGKDFTITITEANTKEELLNLANIRSLIHCDMLQAVILPTGETMWMDEDGKEKGLDINQRATNLLMFLDSHPDDYVVGIVAITKPEEIVMDDLDEYEEDYDE